MCHLSQSASWLSMHGVRDPHFSQLKYHSVLPKSLRHLIYSTLRANVCCFFFLLSSSFQGVAGSLLLDHQLCFMKPQKSPFGPLKRQLCHVEANRFLGTLFWCFIWSWRWVVGGGKTKEDQEDGSKERKKIICRNKWYLLINFELFKLLNPTVHVIESTQPLLALYVWHHIIQRRKREAHSSNSPQSHTTSQEQKFYTSILFVPTTFH